MEHPTSAQALERTESAPQRVFIEVGTNRLPRTWIGTKKFGPDELYIGIDVSLENAQESRGITQHTEGLGENMLFMRARGERLPVAEHSVHELFMGNVLGDPHITDSSKDRFIGEASRVLTDDGTLVIKENNTPAELGDVMSLLQRHQLRVERRVEYGSPEWSEAVSPYDTLAARGSRPFSWGYIIFAKRSANTQL